VHAILKKRRTLALALLKVDAGSIVTSQLGFRSLYMGAPTDAAMWLWIRPGESVLNLKTTGKLLKTIKNQIDALRLKADRLALEKAFACRRPASPA
jgi:hypothetical protein